MQTMLRCYAEGRPGAWEAVCLDFDIAVQGDNFEDVYHSLHEAIGLYLASVRDLPAEERTRFLQRRAPILLRLKFLWHVFRATVSGNDDPMKGRAEFTLPCAA